MGTVIFYELDPTLKGEYLSVRLKADNSYEASEALWKELYQLSIKYDCKKIFDNDFIDTLFVNVLVNLKQSQS